MQVKIRSNARSLYIGRTASGHNSFTDWTWAEVMGMLEGETLPIDTTFLFKDQLNTEGLPPEEVERILAKVADRVVDLDTLSRCRKALEQGIRVMAWMWESIEGDIRGTRQFCGWCHHHSDIHAKECENCGKGDRLELLVRKAS